MNVRSTLSHFFLPLIKVYIIWLVVFDLFRILFLVHNYSQFESISFGEIVLAFLVSLRLDFATMSVLMLPLIPFLYLYLISRKVVFLKSFNGLFWLLTTCIVLIHAGEIIVYPEWNHKLSSRVFTHLANPDEVGRTASWGMTFLFLVYLLIAGWIIIRLKKKFILLQKKEPVHLKTGLILSLVFLLTLPFMIVFGRGGFQQIPLNIDSALYSNNTTANDLSTNSTYYFAKSFLMYQRGDLEKDLPKIDESEALAIQHDLFATPEGESPTILTTETPNLVFIILESWSANTVQSIVGEKGVTKEFDRLAQQGLLFDRLYSTGTTSEIGNASIFAGFPSLPEISLTKQPEKSRQLPSINQDLKKRGYSSAYMFGGDLKYGNIGGFFQEHGFDKITDEKDFPAELPKGKLSIYDEDLLNAFLKDINASSEPFLQAVFTGSTHSPYDHPKRPNQTFKGPEQDFMNSIIYADEEIGKFLQRCQKEKWYKNTLFVLVADHGHGSPSETNPTKGGFFHIPLLLFGEVIRPEFRGTRCHTVGSQSDIAATLLHQLNLPSQAYPWSRDLLHPKAQNFAFHRIVRGYGWVSEKGNLSYSMDYKDFLDNTYPKAFLNEENHKAQSVFLTLYRYYQAL